MTPKEIEHIPMRTEAMFYELQDRIMKDIVRRIRATGEITSTADYQINKVKLLGGSTEFIESEIKRLTGKTDAEIWQLYDETLEKEYTRNRSIYEQINAEFVPYEENEMIRSLAEAIAKQTQDEISNITRSLGFRVDYGLKKVFMPFAEYYQKYLDSACLDIVTGAFDYSSVLRRVVKGLTASGIRTVDYETGHCNRATVAARRAVMTGIHQLNSELNEQTAKELDTNYFEVTWHSRHRPDHWWGGRVFSHAELVSVCGLGSVTGLCGANCKHSYSAFLPGISVRTYTDAQLANMEDGESKKRIWQGKEYNAYEAEQKQRQLETQMRKYREDVQLLKEGGGSQDDIDASKAKYVTTLHKYRSFSDRMKLPEQMNRVYIDGIGKIA